ncbi:YeiH family protein [Salinithrix halophila]|uniref:YeiH family protein n=1 Tax=Salinithrix halophila TaxID=1485204 RepID=A0ABV8JJ57_9BACL
MKAPSVRISRGEKPNSSLTIGLLLTFSLAGTAFLLAELPGVQVVGPLITAIFLAALWTHAMGCPAQAKAGIQFSSKILLRTAIILYGFRLDMIQVLTMGPGLLLGDIAVVFLGVTTVWVFARWLKAEPTLAFLLGAGTGICGAAAIAAVSPIIQAKDDDTATGVGMIALTGTLFTLAYTALRPFLPFSSEQYAIWAGLSLHELAHVAAAASPAGSGGMAVSLLTKMGRVLLLIPFCLFLLLWNKLRQGRREGSFRVEFPWFLVGFLATSLLGSLYPLPEPFSQGVIHLGTFLLTVAMAGLGFTIHLHSLRKKGLRALGALLAGSLLLSLTAAWLATL